MARRRVLINALSMSDGGGRSYVINLLRELGRDDRGFDFTLLAQAGHLDGIDTHNIPVREPRFPRPIRVVWRVAYEELVMPLLASRFDLLYCIADLAPRFAGAPTVILLSNLNVYDHHWYDNARTRALERLVRFGLPNASRLVVPSQAAADLIGERVPLHRDRVRVVHFGVDLDSFKERPGNAPPTTRYVFLPAALERHKNIEVLIDGLARTADRGLELWIAGESASDPRHREVLRRRAEATGVGGRVKFLGAVPYSELLHYYCHAKAFAFPSFIETFGLPLLEAMAVGTPALVSDIPTFREIAGDAALYFAPHDPAAVARAIDTVQSDPEAARRRSLLGQERAARFTWRASVDGLCEVFSEVLGGRRGRAR